MIGNLKIQTILKDVEDNLKKLKLGTKTLCYKIESLNLKEIIKNNDIYPLIYFKRKNIDHHILGIGSAKKFSKIEDYHEMEYLIKENENLDILGGQSFDKKSRQTREWKEFGNFYFFIPQVVIENRGILKINLIANNDNKDIQKKLEKILALKIKDMQFEDNYTFNICKEIPSKEDWCIIFNNLIEKFNNRNLKKIVLSRKKIFQSSKNINPTSILSATKISKNIYCFYMQTSSHCAFLSTSPEMLFKKQLNNIEVDAIAGTRPRSDNLTIDKSLENELKNCPKENYEHKVVYKQIYNNLKPLCKSLEVSKYPNILKLTNLQHLYTSIKGEIKNKTSLKDIINCLHPTSAVGGEPKDTALKILSSIESYSRGLYASPIGYLSKNICEIIVGIRSSLIHKNQLHTYAGAGIVKDSNIQSEWREIECKIKSIQSF